MKDKIEKALFYARVSTASAEQESSIENQISLAESFLKKHPEIVLAEPIDSYVEKVSGKSDCREGYISLMARLSKGDIDYLIVKDLKRLNRSTEVSAQLKNLCRKYKFLLILLETGRVYDPNAEENRMLYGFEALINEEVVHRQSTYGKIAFRQKLEALRLNANNVTFGYKWNEENDDMEIDESAAEVVRALYEKVLFEDLGVKEIRNWLKSIGIKVCESTIRRWLHESAYIGRFAMNKKTSEIGVGSGQKTKHKRIPKEEWVYVDRDDLRIVNQEIYDLVQRVMESRKVVYNNKSYDHTKFHGLHLFSSKVFCKECGNSYVHCWSDRKKTISVYKDSHGKKNEDNPCVNVNYKKIYETDLEKIVLAAINGFIAKNEECFTVLLKAIESTLTNGLAEDKEQQRIERKIQRAEKEAEKVLESYLETSGALKLALAEKYEKIMLEIESMKKLLHVDVDQDANCAVLVQRIAAIRNRVGTMKFMNSLDRDIVLRYVKRIEIDKNGQIEVFLNVESMYQTQIDAWKSKKQSPSKGTAFFAEKISILYVFNEEFYRNVVSEIARGIAGA